MAATAVPAVSALATRSHDRLGKMYTSTPTHQPSASAPTQADALATTRLRATVRGCSQPGQSPISPSLILVRT